MDWPLAIERNRAALLAVVAAVAALVGGSDGPVARGLRKAALALLRPAEAAARRLIVIAARGLAVALRPARPFPAGLAFAGRAGARPPAFPLFDPPKLYAPAVVIVPPPRGTPRIRTFWTSPFAQPVDPVAPPAAPTPGRPDWQAPVDAARLRLRLAGLSAALADLPRQARRLARLRAKLEARAANGPRPRQPLRLGHPPGWRQRPDREVDEVLRDCHALAREALRADTS
jgi:hypothetical protein